jgi:branched-chain amino acid aminotransferase
MVPGQTEYSRLNCRTEPSSPLQPTMSAPLVYLNGRTMPASEAHLAIYDAGVVFGATVAEQTRTFRHQLFRLENHLDRLFRSLRSVRLEIEQTKDELAAVSHELVKHNAALLPPAGELGLIHFITAGEIEAYAWPKWGVETKPVGGSDRPHLGPLPEGEGVVVGNPKSNPGAPGQNPKAPTVCVHTFPLDWRRWARSMREGVHLVTPSVRQVPAECVDPQIKCRSRMHYYLADQEARLVDPQASALLLDLDGNISETSSANFLIVDRGVIVSPAAAGALPGISRATVIELAGQLGIPFVERDLQTDHAIKADEALLTSTPYCLMPVTKINGLPIGDGKPGPVFRRLLTAWSQLVGIDIERQVVDGAVAWQ